MEQDKIYRGKSEAGAIDFTPFLGTWVNSNQNTQWIKNFTLIQQGNQFVLHSYGVHAPQDWGEKEVILFVNEIGEIGFWTKYDLGTFESLLAANTNLGLWIVAAHLTFKDVTKPNFLCREFYYRVS